MSGLMMIAGSVSLGDAAAWELFCNSRFSVLPDAGMWPVIGMIDGKSVMWLGERSEFYEWLRAHGFAAVETMKAAMETPERPKWAVGAVITGFFLFAACIGAGLALWVASLLTGQ